MELKPAKRAAVFAPRTMGVFVLLIIFLSFAAGAVRREMVLTLTGAVFLAVWLYCLAMTLLLALVHRRRAGAVSIRLSPEKITAGGWTQAIYSEGREIPVNEKIFQLPGILVRCRVQLSTKDGRRLIYDFKPEHKTGFEQWDTFQAKKRGAYFSAYDEFAVFDILGFFRFAFRIPAEGGARLLVSPHTESEPVPVRAKGGETERQDAPVLERTDDLIDHRPYVPGDDPRRINWKLYSHGGELFIRQGEREPPPHSNMTILIDTQFDSLYTAKSAPGAVDLLCENALAIIGSDGKEKDIQIGFTGQTEKTGSSFTAAEQGFFLSYPYALCPTAADLPPVPEKRGILILAAPRITAQSSALDRFLSGNANRTMEVVFLYGACENNRPSYEEQAEAAEMCAAIYNRRPGVTARAIGVGR
jgi:hypothetical protein